MLLSSNCYSLFGRIILIYLIDVSILIRCNEQSTIEHSSSNFSMEVFHTSALNTMTKYPQLMSTTAAAPTTSEVLLCNSTGDVPRKRRRRRGRNRMRRKDEPIPITCIEQSTINRSEVAYNSSMNTLTKYPQLMSTIAAASSTSEVLPSNSTGVVQRKQRRRNKMRRKGTLTSTKMSIVLADESRSTNNIDNVTTRRKKNRRRKGKFKKRRRNKTRTSHNNILEITTAKVFSLPMATESTLTEMIKKINENPEGDFDEYKRKLADRTLSLSSGSLFLANLVGPHPKTLDNPNGTNLIFKSNIQRGDRNKKYSKCKKYSCAHICHPERKNKCSCLQGFYLAGDGKSCIDINECKLNNGGCETTCLNTLGSYECRCPEGLRLSDDLKTCEDINECLLRNGHGLCQGTCENRFGNYTCSCAGLNGTRLAADGHSCEDLDECAKDNGGCSHECINTLGRAFCGCPRGLELTDDWKTCRDTNECEDDIIKESCGNNCLNTVGSYHCLGRSDLQQDQATTNFVCKPLFPPARGFIRCSRNNAFQSFTKKGRKRIINSPGTVCELICPRKYKKSKKYHVMCGWDGKWVGEKGGKCVERINLYG